MAKLAAHNHIENSDGFSDYAMQVYDIKDGNADLFSEHSGEGLFYQKDINTLGNLFINEKCQTLSILMSEKTQILEWVVSSRISGIDRVCDIELI